MKWIVGAIAAAALWHWSKPPAGWPVAWISHPPFPECGRTGRHAGSECVLVLRAAGL